ncbi:putative uncharacterized protein C5orf58 homolog isoform X2 [Callithrix jacchus]
MSLIWFGKVTTAKISRPPKAPFPPPSSGQWAGLASGPHTPQGQGLSLELVGLRRRLAGGSEVRQIGEILPAQEKVEAKIYLKMSNNSVTDHKLHVEKIIKNINTISLELKKIKELSQLLLCDLTLHFNHPMKTENLTEAERNNLLFEEAKISDVSLVSNSFSI